jgi:hypothetical protein
MADTPADVRRNIERTRTRMSETLQALEHKMQVSQLVRDHPWPAVGLAVGGGLLLGGLATSEGASEAAARATPHTASRLGRLLDAVIVQVAHSAQSLIEQQFAQVATDLRQVFAGTASTTRPAGARPVSSSVTTPDGLDSPPVLGHRAD